MNSVSNGPSKAGDNWTQRIVGVVVIGLCIGLFLAAWTLPKGAAAEVRAYLLDRLGETAVGWSALVVGLLGFWGGIFAVAFLLYSAKASAEAKRVQQQPYRLQPM